MSKIAPGLRTAVLVAVALAVTLTAAPADAARPKKPVGLRLTAATRASLHLAWRAPRTHGARRYGLYLRGHRVVTTRAKSATLVNLECGRDYVIQVDTIRSSRLRSRRATIAASTAPCHVIDLAARCSDHNCDAAFDGLQAGMNYHLPAGVWTLTKPVRIPSNVTLTGDGTGINGTDLVYSGAPISGAVVTAGAPGRDWSNGHIAGIEIETDQLHKLRLRGDTASAMVKINQAGVGLEILNPTATSTVTNVNAWKFGRASMVITNRAASPGAGFFQLSNFFVGTSPHPLEVRGSKAKLLLRFGGIDLGPLSELGMDFDGDTSGATAVVESVKIEGDYDVPGYVVDGGAPVVFVGTTRYLNQSLYVGNPINSAPAFVNRDASTTLQCLACTALGEQTALALPDQGREVAASKWGINLHRLTADGARSVADALATPETPVPRPRDVVELGPLCAGGNCDAAFAGLKPGGRYHLPAGVWQFSRPFTIPTQATFFGDGPTSTVLRYVGDSLPGDAAVKVGSGGWDTEAIRLFSLSIDTQRPLGGGFGVRARDATNATTIEDISIAGFPDGQLQLDNTPAGGGSGPNFVRVARFSLTGGTHPLEVDEGRQTVLVEQGDIRLGATSQEGLNLSGGEQLAATRVIGSVSVQGGKDVPGFRVRGPAVTAFINAERTTSGSRLTSPGFLYNATVPRAATECLRCWVSGLKTAFAMPQLDVDIAGRDLATFDHLNADAGLKATDVPFNVSLPTVSGPAVAGQTVTASNGAWKNSPSRYAYQWIRCKRPDVPSDPATRCTAIDGATGSAYAVGAADSGFYLRVSVVASNAGGARSATSLAALASG